MHFDYIVDARNETCPMPLLRAKQQLNKMESGQSVKVLASDAASVRDFASFISLAGHELFSEVLKGEGGYELYQYIIIKR